MKKRKDLYLTVHERCVIADLLNQLYYNGYPSGDIRDCSVNGLQVHINFCMDAVSYGKLVDLRFKFLQDLQKNE